MAAAQQLLAAFGAWNPTALPGIVLRVVADPAYCFSDSGGTTPCGVGDSIYTWKLANDTSKKFQQATSGRRPVLRQSGSVYYAEFAGASTQYMQLSASLSLSWKSLAVRYADNNTVNYVTPFGTSFAPNAVYCGAAFATNGILDGSFSEAATLSASAWSNNTIIASLSGTPPTRTTGGATTFRNLLIARASNASRNEQNILGADFDDPTGRCINGAIQELILFGAGSATEAGLLQTYWGA